MSDVQAPLLAGGDSWKWQLRDSKGKWIEMGAKVKWMAKGVQKAGEVVGSPKPGVATVEEDKSKDRSNIASSRLTVYDMGSYVKGQAEKSDTSDVEVKKPKMSRNAKEREAIRARMAKASTGTKARPATADEVKKAAPSKTSSKALQAAHTDIGDLLRDERSWEESELSENEINLAEGHLRRARKDLAGTASDSAAGTLDQMRANALKEIDSALRVAGKDMIIGRDLRRIRKSLTASGTLTASCAPKKRKRRSPMLAAIVSTSAAKMAGRISAREAGL